MSNKRRIEEIEEEEVVGAPDVLPVEELAESFIDENGESMQEGEEQVEPETMEPMLQDGDGSRGSGGLSFDPVEYREKLKQLAGDHPKIDFSKIPNVLKDIENIPEDELSSYFHSAR